MKHSLPRPGNMVRVTGTLRAAALRVTAVLELIRKPEAQRLRQQIHAQLAATTEAVARAAAAKKAINAAKLQSVHTDAGFVAGLKGLLAMIEAGDSKLFSTLPSVENLSKVDPDGYGNELATALRTAGKVGATLANLVQSAMDTRLERKRAYAAALISRVHLNKGQASVADLKSLLTTAESLIHNTVEPGSPLLDMLKPPRKPRKRKGKEEKKTGGEKPQQAKDQQAPKTATGDAAHPPETSSSTSQPASPPVPPSTVVPPPSHGTNVIVAPATLNGATVPETVAAK